MTMSPKTTSFVGLVLCMIISSGSFAVVLDERYIPLPTKDEIGTQWNHYKPIKLALDALGVHDGMEHSLILERAKELAAKETNHVRSNVYKMLVDLVAQNQPCHGDMAKYWLKVYALIKTNQGASLGELAHYLEHFGKIKFGICAKRAEEEFVGREPSESSYKKLLWRDEDMDALIIRMQKMKRHPNDQELYDAAKSFDLAKLAANRSGRNKLRKFVKKTTDMYPGAVAEYLKAECYYIQYAPDNLFEVINLAHAFGSYQISDPKLLKMNEFFRILCVSPAKPEVKAMIAQC